MTKQRGEGRAVFSYSDRESFLENANTSHNDGAGLLDYEQFNNSSQASGERNESSKDILKQTEQLMQDAQSKSKEIAEKYEEMFGNSDMAFIFDPKLLAERNAVLGESMDSFLERTLMTGSDIVDISLNMLHDFADITLSLDLKT